MSADNEVYVDHTRAVVELAEHLDFVHRVIDPETHWLTFVGADGDLHSYDLATEAGRRWCASDWPAEWNRAKGNMVCGS